MAAPLFTLSLTTALRSVAMSVCLCLGAWILLGSVGAAPAAGDDGTAGGCLICHEELTPGLYQQWKHSTHAELEVTCLDCHQADSGDPDAFEHNGAVIATMVTPRDCAQCHPDEADQFENSHHAKAGQILSSADNYLAGVMAGHPVVVAGCESCHGTAVRIDEKSPNKLDRLSWPNSGIGRINPDGSLGACTACHTRHDFTRTQARQPENCGKCHLGPDHPQKEIYEESKHGITYHAYREELNLDRDVWIVGQDYWLGPTCATCHMSATLTQPITHDAGDRISWTLRPPVSRKQENWQEKRRNMQEVCRTCHSPSFVEGHYVQFDGVVNLYDEKFGKPATRIMEIIRKNNSLERPATFSNRLEWIYWELWHHEGRRGRMGAAMMGPDYTWWHGLYEVGKHFYMEFVPLVRETEDAEAVAALDELLATDPMHKWFSQNAETNRQALNSGELERLYRELYPGLK